MYFLDGKAPTIRSLLVGTGGVTKGDLLAWSSNTVVRAAAAASDATIVGIALETAVDTAMCLVDVGLDRVIRSEFAGTASNLATNKIYDLTDANTVNINDTTDGIFYCVGYDAAKGTVDGIITHVHRAIEEGGIINESEFSKIFR